MLSPQKLAETIGLSQFFFVDCLRTNKIVQKKRVLNKIYTMKSIYVVYTFLIKEIISEYLILLHHFLFNVFLAKVK